jgi:hypothetical protein
VKHISNLTPEKLLSKRQTLDNNAMHAKPDLRVFFNVEITLPAR